MQSVDDYAAAAKARNSIKSDRQLSLQLGLSEHAVTQWRTRRAWPAEETMRRLAGLAGRDETAAMVDLARWRAATPEVRKVWDRIAKKMAATAAALALVTFVTLGSGGQVQARPTGTGTVYIMENILGRLRRMLARAALA